MQTLLMRQIKQSVEIGKICMRFFWYTRILEQNFDEFTRIMKRFFVCYTRILKQIMYLCA